jgi:hypothetical protein
MKYCTDEISVMRIHKVWTGDTSKYDFVVSLEVPIDGGYGPFKRDEFIHLLKNAPIRKSVGDSVSNKEGHTLDCDEVVLGEKLYRTYKIDGRIVQIYSINARPLEDLQNVGEAIQEMVDMEEANLNRLVR